MEEVEEEGFFFYCWGERHERWVQAGYGWCLIESYRWRLRLEDGF